MRIGRVTGEVDGFDAIDDWAREREVACVYLLSPDDPGRAAEAENAGFRLVDVRVELGRPSVGDETSSLRPSSADDAAVLRELARSNHRITRFYADPNFPDERCDDLYETWIARSLEGWADEVLVTEADGRPAGYVSLHARADHGSIGLIGVAPEAQGRGLGRALVEGAVAWARACGLERVTVVTQARNVAALRTFEACRFRTDDVGLWFHKWYDR